MAYFPNGSSGEVLDAQCLDCLIPDDWPCPILMAQQWYNYDQCEDSQEKLRDCLNGLVSEKGICQMKTLIDKLASTMAEKSVRRELERHGQTNFLKGGNK